MPEGDALHRAARRLQVLAGQRVEVETPHPRAAGKQLAERLDGRLLESVEAVGKNLLLHFEGGLVLRSHLRMTGRWRVEPRGSTRAGRPWLVLRGADHEAVLWNGPVLELGRGNGVARRSARTSSRARPRSSRCSRVSAPCRRSVRSATRSLDQRLVAGIGNMWKAEALWDVRVSPWRPLADVERRGAAAVLEAAHEKMRAGVEGTRPLRHVYRRAARRVAAAAR